MKCFLFTYCALCLLAVGCGTFETTSEPDSKQLASLNRDALSSDVEAVAKRAQMFYYRPARLGGGGQSFIGITIEALVTSVTNKNGTYSVLGATEDSVIVVGVGHEVGDDGTSPVKVSALVKAGSIKTTVEN